MQGGNHKETAGKPTELKKGVIVKTRFVKLASIAFGLLWATQSATFAEGQGNIYGKIYADWYDNQSNIHTLDATAARAGFDLTRAYFGYDYKIDTTFGANVCLDVSRIAPLTKVTGTVNDSSGLSSKAPVTVTQSADSSFDAFLKFAYLTWKNVLPFTTLSAGQISYFAFDVQEAFWDHRYIYKTLMDQQGWESSADLGAKAVFVPDPMLKVTLGVTDGEGYKKAQDINGDFKTALGIQVNPVKEFTVYLYGDCMQVGNGTAPGKDWTQSTGSLFAGYCMPDMAKLGVEFDGQTNKGGVAKHTVSGVSVNGSYNILKPLQVFGRFDMVGSEGNWNTGVDGRTAIGGIQYSPVKKFKLAADYQWVLARPYGTTGASAAPTASDMIVVNAEIDY
jgi:hypothetical protein